MSCFGLLGSSKSTVEYHGLRFPDRSSCLNSVLQVLFMTKAFQEVVERNNLPLLKQLLDDLKKETADASDIKMYEQADAATCLEQILTNLTNHDASKLFQGTLRDTNTCDTCRTETNTDESFWFLPLQMVESDRGCSVVDRTDQYFKESFINGENQMYCDGCGAKSDAVSRRLITEHPEVLMLRLETFNSDHRSQPDAKSKCSVDIPYVLQIPENETYELYAFLEQSFAEGYSATIKSPDNEKWYQFCDGTVTLNSKLNCEEKNHKSENACFLFYKKSTKHFPDSLTQNTNKVVTSVDICRDDGDNIKQRQDHVNTISPGHSSLRQYHGLINQGATCYLNSVLQVLFMTKDFREAVEGYEDDDVPCVDRCLQELFDDLKNCTARTFKITQQLGLRVYEQADAATCLEQILTNLTNDDASKLFQGTLRDTNTCDTCRTETNTDELFWFLPLQMVESDRGCSVADGFSEYFKESIINGENQMYCDGCGAKSDAVSKRELKDHPAVLMLLLKRFTYRNNRYVKNHCAVDVPCALQSPHNQTYELYAVVNHFGDLRSGHYTATIKSQDDDKKWHEFNDDTVKESGDMEDILKSSTAYLLFYRKQKSTCTEDKREVSTDGDTLPATTDIDQQMQDTAKKEKRTEACGTDTDKHYTDSNVQTHSFLNQKALSALSSVLHVLYRTEDFREAVDRSMFENQDIEHLDHLLKVIFDELEGNRNTSRTSELINNLDLPRGKEQDAAEYLVKILSLTSTDASQIFFGQLTDKTICYRCFAEKTVEQPLQPITLPMTDSICKTFSVVDGIEEYFRTRIWLKYQISCGFCGVSGDAHVSQTVIQRHPEVLVVGLKRFELNNHFKIYTKNKRAVNVPRTLTLPGNQMYELYAFVDHVGDLKCGHCDAAIKSQDDKWYNYDDSGVTLLDYQPFQVDNAENLKNVCLLFYKTIDTASTKIQEVEQERAIKDGSDRPGPVLSNRNGNTGCRKSNSIEKREVDAADHKKGKNGDDKSTSYETIQTKDNLACEFKDSGDRKEIMTKDDDCQAESLNGKKKQHAQGKGASTMNYCDIEQNWPKQKDADANKTRRKSRKCYVKIIDETTRGSMLIKRTTTTRPLSNTSPKSCVNNETEEQTVSKCFDKLNLNEHSHNRILGQVEETKSTIHSKRSHEESHAEIQAAAKKKRGVNQKKEA